MDECDIKMSHVTLQILYSTDGISESVYVLEFAQSRVTFVRLFFYANTNYELSIQRPGYDNKNIIIIEKLSIHLCE